MTLLISLLGAIGPLSLLALFFIFAQLSERFGTVIKMRPYYRGYYLGSGFIVIGVLVHLIIAGANLEPTNQPTFVAQSWFLFWAYHLPLTIGVTINLIITWLYWGWLVTEYNR